MNAIIAMTAHDRRRMSASRLPMLMARVGYVDRRDISAEYVERWTIFRQVQPAMVWAPLIRALSTARPGVHPMTREYCDSDHDEAAPTPGSDAAISAGCTCPVLDNSHGAGWPASDGASLYWFTAGCPVHDGPER